MPHNLCTPHGIHKSRKNDHWGKTRKTLSKIPQRHITIWGADANGQIGRTEGQPEQYHRAIGPYTLHQGMEKGNVIQLAHKCKQQHKTTQMNSWERENSTSRKTPTQTKQRHDSDQTKHTTPTAHHAD